MRLTKTDILAGLQCHKELFLSKNHPEYRKSHQYTGQDYGRGRRGACKKTI